MANKESSTASTKKPRKRKYPRKDTSHPNSEIPRYSYIVKPQDLTLEQWQIALRKQVALKEDFLIRSRDDREHDRHGYYSIKKVLYEPLRIQKGHDENTKPRPIGYGPEHTVVYRGEGSKWNYCSCMDFKTSALGTCKHLEAVKMWLKDNKIPVNTSMSQASSLYIDYKDGRKIKLRLGNDNQDEIANIAQHYFDINGVPYTDNPAKLIEFIQLVKEVSPSFRCYDDVIELLNEQRLRKYVHTIAKDVDDHLINSLLKTNLYPYQLEGIKFAFSTGRCIIADEMGLGKTIQAIGTAELLKHFRLASSVLIVCPTSLKYQWKFEIEKFTNSTVTVIEGNPTKRQKLYETDPAFYKIVSYNTMANDIKYNGKLSADLIIMDEVQRLKNWNTIIAKAARHLKSSFSVILSGTPLENKLEELFSIVELVDQYYLGPYYRFRNEYIKTDESGMTVGYVNLNSIGERLNGILIRRQKKQVALQMPRRQDKTLYVPMTKEQTAIHEDMEYKLSMLIQRWRHMGFLSELDRQRLMLLLGQMRMAANSTFIIDQKSRHDTKIEEAMNILEDVLECSDEKVVIFSGWERMTRLIAMELDKMGVKYSYLHGGIPSAKRRGLVENFTRDPECKVFLSTDAGATGLNLQAGSIIINLELPWNPAVLEQRIGRIYRLGQMRNIQVINMVSIGSIEKAIEEKIKFKSALFEGILDNGQDSVFLPDKNKFEELMESLSSMMDQKEAEQQEPKLPEDVDADLEGDNLETSANPKDSTEDADTESDIQADTDKAEQTVSQETDSEESETEETEEKPTDEILEEEEGKKENSSNNESPERKDDKDHLLGDTKENNNTNSSQTSDQGNFTQRGNASSSKRPSSSPSSSSSNSTTGDGHTEHAQGHASPEDNQSNEGSSGSIRSSNEQKAEQQMMDQDDIQDSFGTSTPTTPRTAPAAPSTPADLVAQGISFFSGLAQTLSSPQKTKELVDSIVKTDEKTGRTTLEIPVPDKSTVNTLLSTIGALFANIGR